MNTTKITDATFDADVIQASKSKPVLLDFWAEWCGPCKQIGPYLEEMAADMKDTVTVAKMNVDENPSTPQKFQVRGIPTLILFKDGKVASTKIGATSKSKLVEWVNQSLGA
jgi:thioredoxin 1